MKAKATVLVGLIFLFSSFGSATTLDLQEGWNIVSPVGSSLTESNIMAQCGVDTREQVAGPWTMSNPPPWNWGEPSRVMEPNKGYWVKMPSSCSVDIDTAVEYDRMQLDRGWNFVSPVTGTLRETEIMDRCDIDSRSDIDGPWTMYDVPPWNWDMETTMVADKGYWLKMPYSCSLNFDFDTGSDDGEEDDGEDQKNDKDEEPRSGRIELSMVEEPEGGEFQVYSNPSFRVNAVDDRDLDDNQKKFYGPESYIEMSVDYPYSGEAQILDRDGGACDRQTLRECSASIILAGRHQPSISGDYTLNVKAETVDGATERLSSTYTAKAPRQPPEGRPNLHAGFSGFEPVWSTEKDDDRLEFATSRNGEKVLIDTGDNGFCGDAFIEREVSLGSSEGFSFSVDYKASGERHGDKQVAVKWNGEKIRGIDNPSVDPWSESGTWEVQRENPGFTGGDYIGTLKVGIEKTDSSCGLIAQNSDIRLMLSNPEFRKY